MTAAELCACTLKRKERKKMELTYSACNTQGYGVVRSGLSCIPVTSRFSQTGGRGALRVWNGHLGFLSTPPRNLLCPAAGLGVKCSCQKPPAPQMLFLGTLGSWLGFLRAKENYDSC